MNERKTLLRPHPGSFNLTPRHPHVPFEVGEKSGKVKNKLRSFLPSIANETCGQLRKKGKRKAYNGRVVECGSLLGRWQHDLTVYAGN